MRLETADDFQQPIWVRRRTYAPSPIPFRNAGTIRNSLKLKTQKSARDLLDNCPLTFL